MTDTIDLTGVWIAVCASTDLIPDRGVCARVGDDEVAIFRVGPEGSLYAIGNHDPFSDASVLSRGIVGSKGDAPKVSSPMYKQSFDLRTGICLDDADVSVATYAIRERDGIIEVCSR